MNDSLNPKKTESVSPLDEHEDAPGLQNNSTEFSPPQQRVHHQKLTQARKSQLAQLLAGSPWILKAYQLDMDCPPAFGDFIDLQLTEMLRHHSGSSTAIDDQTIHRLNVEFHSDDQPSVDPDGTEHYNCRLSLSQLALSTRDPSDFLGLLHRMEPDRPVSPLIPGLTLGTLMQKMLAAPWTYEYQRLLEGFWLRHASTYQLLVRLAFLDGLCELKTKHRISLEGYVLALDALGLERIPQSLTELATPAQPRRSEFSLITLNGQIVPGVFQLKSKSTSHCFVHVLGPKPVCIEYISRENGSQIQPFIDALNSSPWHRLHMDTDPQADIAATLNIVDSQEGVFDVLTRAQREFSRDRLDSYHVEHIPDEYDDTLSLPIQRAVNLIAAMDLWDTRASLRSCVPDPMKVANRLMEKHLQQKYGLKLDPRQVFIRYQPGNRINVLGHARAPVTNVQVPDDAPISLGQALINQYRVAYPVGYIDEGAGSVVYLDPSKKGEFSEQTRLPITAQALEQFIRGIDFLQVMARRLERFWDKHGATVEQSLRSSFIAQALLGLKRGTLSRHGFDMLVKTLDETDLPLAQRQTRCSALGFYLQSSVFQGAQAVFNPALMVFCHTNDTGGVLYQAGQQEAFFEFSQRSQLAAHLVNVAADPQWRKTLLDYAPQQLHSRLGYILELWGRTREPTAPASLLRPWTDRLYNEDAHLAVAGELCESAPVLSPFKYMCDTLRSNSLNDAENSISTSAQVTLQYWADQLLRLQRLLAPLSLVLAPATIASLVTAAATLALDMQSAALPGKRSKDKRQILLTLLSFGLLQMAPLTPGLLRGLRSFTSPAKCTAAVATVTRGFNWQLQRSMNQRRTQLERFFGTESLLKSWTVPGYPAFATFPVKAWKLERKFVLWTSDRGQARTLIVSTHGYYLPWSRTTAIPNGTELRTYVPHGFELVDPRLHRIVSQNVKPLSLLNNTASLPGPALKHLPGWQMTDKLLAGTSQPGRIKNYTLAKFQSEQYESYRDISNIVRQSHQSPFFGQLMPTPMDVLTVRNRFGVSNPSLQDLFGTLFRQGIHYDHILLVHCRCSAIQSFMGRAPSFTAPLGATPITP